MPPPPSSKKSIHPAEINTRSHDSVVRGGKKRYSSLTLDDDRKRRSTPLRKEGCTNDEFDSDEEYNYEEAEAEPVANSRQKVNRRSHDDGDDDFSWKTSYNSLEAKQAEMDERVSSMERKLLLLDNKIESQKAASLLIGKSGRMQLFTLSEWQAAKISECVRPMFKAIKYFDRHCINQQGKKIYDACLRRANMTGEETDQQTLFASVKSVILRTLSQARCHNTSYIREEARGMFLLYNFL